MRTNWTVNLICIALDIIGAILFFPGISELHDYGYNYFFDSWAQSYLDSITEAGTKATIGIVLMAIGLIGSIIHTILVNRVNVNSKFSARDESLESIFKNASSAHKSAKNLCPHCGNVVTSDICEMCGRSIH